MKLPPRINTIIDIGGLVVALVVDLVLNFTCFCTIAPDMFTRVAFVAIGIMTVLFVLRSWSKRQFAFYIIFLSVVFFFDYSFTLESTRVQAQEASDTKDAELERIQQEIDSSNTALEALNESYNLTLKKWYPAGEKQPILDGIQKNIDTENKKLLSYQEDYKQRQISGNNKEVTISSKNIMHAIPTAWKDKRYIDLIIYGLIFAGLQFIVASSIDNSKQPEVVPVTEQEPPKNKKRTVKPLSKDDISRWVNWNWYRIESGASANILPKEVFFDLVKKQNDTFNERIYTRIVSSAKRNGVINKDGKVLVMDKNKAKEMIK